MEIQEQIKWFYSTPLEMTFTASSETRFTCISNQQHKQTALKYVGFAPVMQLCFEHNWLAKASSITSNNRENFN